MRLMIRQEVGGGQQRDIGELSWVAGVYRFQYVTEPARTLPGLPDTDQVYTSKRLFAFFVNRVIWPVQSTFASLPSRFAEMDADSPEFVFEQLDETGGRRVTDRFVMEAI